MPETDGAFSALVTALGVEFDLSFGLQLLVAIGGWSAGPEPFQEITSSDYKMNNFVYETVDFIRKNQLDGIDIDWEYPRCVTSALDS